jgi:hypothetical protein
MKPITIKQTRNETQARQRMGEAHGLGVRGGDAANSDAIQLVNHGPEDRWRDGPTL